MKSKLADLRTRLYLIAAIVLIAGLGGALAVYMRAANEESALAYEETGGYVYPIQPEDSKMYLHDLELYGGKTNVLANEIMRWFTGLWHGKSLAFTIACITVFIAFCFFFVATRLPAGSAADAANPSETGP